ncbi:uncharacterized protein GIQ15_04211 [Arthroderma uncinatum]|uniref:uncharacterized protein n=1 Tax=Arthroderma uncinatum TaxID=74035 RepID=UPI00144AD774|nr:uncharacterized protein GIQ15_04211 [Arthroderma uncinatum]KAF3481452.1 hypothetical protein GIQ15_04211 [Arthroderma uncinatum]
MFFFSDDSENAPYNAAKPPLPYFPGQEFTVRSHIPPPPTSIDCLPGPESHEEWQKKSPLERCFTNPPSPGADGDQLVSLIVSKEIRLEDNHNSQLVIVDVLDVTPSIAQGPQKATTVLAKFYDPLYQDHRQDDEDPFLAVEHDYTHEAAAYTALSELQGTVIPKYYGSFTLELPIDNYETKRLVRLILLELVEGVPMRNLDPKKVSQQQRKEMMKGVIDAETAIYSCYILHCDTHPRNVIINSDPESNRKVTLIDFDRARKYPDACIRPEFVKLVCLPGPASPLLRWHRLRWPGVQSEFDGWIDWDWQTWLEENYSDPQGTLTREMKEFWMPDDPGSVLRLPGLKIW